MEDYVYYNELYDLYGNLLTDKQRKYFEDYYFNNMSLIIKFKIVISNF